MPPGSEREATDQSLSDERLKADDELAKRRTDINETADAIIARARIRADRILKTARAKADEATVAKPGYPECVAMLVQVGDHLSKQYDVKG